MKIRRYTCNDMQEAMLKVKMELGSEAVIMNSRKVKKKGLLGLFSKPMVEVVAAIDDDYIKPSRSAQTRRPPVTEGIPPLYREPARDYGQPVAHPYQPVQNQYAPPQAPYPQPQMAQYQHAVSQEPVIAVNTPVQSKQPEIQSDSMQDENKKINDLESKVKSMESMLEQIYKSISEKQSINPQNDEKPVLAEPAAVSGGENDGMSLLRTILADQELDANLIEKIIEKVKERGGNNLKPEEIYNLAARVVLVLLGEPETISLRTDGRPQIAIFVGPTGVGKTTTLAKIAADFTLNKQKKVGLITADTYRIAAVEQLKTYAEILNIPVTVVYSPNEIQEAIKKLSDKDLILIDTAGRSHKHKTHFDELKSLINSAAADETYLVISANTSRTATREILEYYSFIKNYKLLFTKLDEASVPGLIINARYMTGRPLSYTTAGQSVPDDLDVANAKTIVSSFLGSKVNL